MPTTNRDAELRGGPLGEVHTQIYRRLALMTRVTQHSGLTTYWRSENVSEGGIFVRAAPTLPPGSEIEIGFFLPTIDTEVRCHARVTWRNDANTPDFDPHRPYGMGMEFMDLAPELRDMIRRYVAGRPRLEPRS